MYFDGGVNGIPVPFTSSPPSHQLPPHTALPVTEITLPDDLSDFPQTDASLELIDGAYEAIERFMLSDQEVIENFVNCDFHLVDQAIGWITDQGLAAGDRFCELGAGFGVAAMLANLHKFEAVGIEIEQALVDESAAVAEQFDIDVGFFAGSFIPRATPNLPEIASDIEHVDTSEGDVFDEIGLEFDDFDLFFAFPWPGEHGFFESVFDACAATNALLLTYRGREGMHLVRKT